MSNPCQKYVKQGRRELFKQTSRSWNFTWLCLLSATYTAIAAALLPSDAFAAPGAQSPYTYVHHAVSTDVASAQFAFDRGLTLIFAYESGEAERSFREAASLDPTLAMAWWG